MKISNFILPFALILSLSATANRIIEKIPYQKSTKISIEVLKDKIKGGWAGQTIGCTYGGPTEFVFCGKINDTEKFRWDDDFAAESFKYVPGLYDDVYLDLTFLEVIDRCGLNAPVDSFANSVANDDYKLWHANQAARYNLLNGLKAPASGHWLNNPHADDIDFQIEADFAGMLCPGMTNVAISIGDKIGHIMNYGDGWYGGVFISSLYSLAYVSTDIEYVVSESLKTIPQKSKYRSCIEDVIRLHALFPNDWKLAWNEIEKKHSFEIGCPDGVFNRFNIDATLNGAYVVMGLLYGDGDFQKTMDIAIRCGQDSDCNPSTAGGIWGVMFGYNKIPQKWKPGYEKIENQKFPYTNKSLSEFYDLNLKYSKEIVAVSGGEVTADSISIQVQKPKQVRWEQSFSGYYPIEKRGLKKTINNVESLSISFKGIGVVLTGSVKRQSPDTVNYVAIIEAWLDGKKVETFNMPFDFIKRKYDIFHKYQLKNKSHTLEIKWLNPAENYSIQANELIVYSNKKQNIK